MGKPLFACYCFFLCITQTKIHNSITIMIISVMDILLLLCVAGAVVGAVLLPLSVAD